MYAVMLMYFAHASHVLKDFEEDDVISTIVRQSCVTHPYYRLDISR